MLFSNWTFPYIFWRSRGILKDVSGNRTADRNCSMFSVHPHFRKSKPIAVECITEGLYVTWSSSYRLWRGVMCELATSQAAWENCPWICKQHALSLSLSLLFCCDGISASLRTSTRQLTGKHLASLRPTGSDGYIFLRAQPTVSFVAVIKLCVKNMFKRTVCYYFYEILLQVCKFVVIPNWISLSSRIVIVSHIRHTDEGNRNVKKKGKVFL